MGKKIKGGSKFFKNLKHGIKKHDRLIGTTLTFIGFGSSLFFTAKASPKVKEIWEKSEDDRHHPDKEVRKKAKIKTAKEIVKVAWPAGVSVAATSVAIVGNHKLNTGKIAGLTGALELATKEKFLLAEKNKVLEEAAKEVIGDDRIEELKEKIEEKEKTKEAPMIGSAGNMTGIVIKPGDVLCRDKWTGIWYSSNEQKLEMLETKIENELIKYDCITYDTILRMLDIPYDLIPEMCEDNGFTPNSIKAQGGGSMVGVNTSPCKTGDGIPYLEVSTNVTPVTIGPLVER